MYVPSLTSDIWPPQPKPYEPGKRYLVKSGPAKHAHFACCSPPHSTTIHMICVCVCVCVCGGGVGGLGGGGAAGEVHYQVNGLCLCARSWAQFFFTQAEQAKPRSDEN